MKFITNLNRISEFFFLVTGVGLIVSFLCWRNNYYPLESEIFLRLADLPLALFGILYAMTSLRLSLSMKYSEDDEIENDDDDDDDEKSKFPFFDVVLIVLGLIIFGIIAYVDIMLPNKFPFPSPS